MFTGKKLINAISLILVITVNVLYLVKYSVIYDAVPFILVPAYIFLVSGIISIASSRRSIFIPAGKFAGKDYKKKVIIPASIMFSAMVLIFILAVPRAGEIGRLPAVEDWIRRFLNGDFPYNSPHTPSSFPAMFLLAYPFYLIGNTGLMEFAGIALFFIIVFKLKDSAQGTAVKILLLVSGLVTYFEIVTRSELLLNMMLAAGVVLVCEKYLKPDRINLNFALTALLTGFIMSTRSVAALLFLIYFIYRFRMQLRNLVLFGIISLTVFILFLVPFYMWDPVSFSKNGPFAVQSYLSNLSFIIIFLFFVSAVYSGWAISNLQEFFFSGGVILFSAAAVSFLLRAVETGFSFALFNDGYDISYFIFCMPMLILAIKDYSVDRYRGRIYLS